MVVANKGEFVNPIHHRPCVHVGTFFKVLIDPPANAAIPVPVDCW